MDMLQFQPPGFEPKSIRTKLGSLTYYTAAVGWPDIKPYINPSASNDSGSSQPFSRPLSQPSNLPPISRPPLLFLHSMGGGSSAYEWSKVYPAFSTTYQVIAPDLIGWGNSAHPPRDYSTGNTHCCRHRTIDGGIWSGKHDNSGNQRRLSQTRRADPTSSLVSSL